MSALAEFKRAERELAIRVRAFQEMKQSPEVQKAIAFEKALDDFLAVHKLSRSALFELLSIEFEGDKAPAKKSHHKKSETPAPKSASKPTGKRTRVFNGVKIRTFKNPETGEELVVRGNRDGKFNAWNAKYGKDVVRSWKISEIDAPPKNP